MKKKFMIFCYLFVTLLVSSELIYGSDQEAVEKVIKGAYFNGAFNDLDTNAMEKGFHPDFCLLYTSDAADE